MSATTKTKRLDAIAVRIKRAEEKARDLRATADQLDDEVQGLKAEQEWLNEAPVRAAVFDPTQPYMPDTEEGQQ